MWINCRDDKRHFVRNGKTACGAKSPITTGANYIKCLQCILVRTHNLVVNIAGFSATYRFISKNQRLGFKQGFTETMRRANFSEAWSIKNAK